MKTLKAIVIALVLTAVGAAPAAAQLKFGPKVGFTSYKLDINKKGFDSKNMAGFTGGVMGEFTLPMIGLGFDASLMYVNHDAKVTYTEDGVKYTDKKRSRSFIEVPINVKYKFSIPAVSNIVSPFLYTGPSFAFLCSKKTINYMRNKSCDLSWNIGLGVELINHIQIAGQYGFGLGNSVKAEVGKAAGVEPITIKGKDRYWTFTAAYLF